MDDRFVAELATREIPNPLFVLTRNAQEDRGAIRPANPDQNVIRSHAALHSTLGDRFEDLAGA